MVERWLSIKQVAEIIGKSSQTVTDYCNEGKFPNASRPGGGKWVIPESDVQTYLTGRPVVASVSVETSSAVKKAEENTQIAEAERKETIARKEAEAAKAGFTTAEEWDKAQKDFNELVEKAKSDIEKEKEQVAQLKKENEQGILDNKELQKQLKEQLKLANESIQEQENINIEAKKEVEENITRILKHFRGGTVGIMEKAVYSLTTPIVTRSFVNYHCVDCHKSDGINRVAHFEIPQLKDCPPNFAFDVCADCDPDQKQNRNLPVFVCDVCPVGNLMKQSAQLIIEALSTVGVKAEFDSDGQYKPCSFVDEKKRHLTKEEQLKLLMQEYRIGENDKAIGEKI